MEHVDPRLLLLLLLLPFRLFWWAFKHDFDLSDKPPKVSKPDASALSTSASPVRDKELDGL
jgi:hypothetical protein